MADSENQLTLVELFAGIGGFSVGFEKAGVKTVAAVENYPPSQATFKKNFPDAALFGDVTKVTGNELRAVGFVPERGIITAGWPCQDISVARRGRTDGPEGLAGERSGLFSEVVRLLEELHPRWFVLENVPRLLSINGGRDMGTVVSALGQCGYGIAYRVLDSQYFGIPQRRRRVFIVGNLGDTGERCAEVLFDAQGVCGDHPQSLKAGQEIAAHAAAGTEVGGGYAGDPLRYVTTLQGGAKRGQRLDAECAAGGHLIAVRH